MSDDKAHIRDQLDFTGAEWIRAEPDGVTLAEVAEIARIEHTDGVTYIALRKSTDPDGVVLVFTPSEWEAFGKGVDDGEFDDLG